MKVGKWNFTEHKSDLLFAGLGLAGFVFCAFLLESSTAVALETNIFSWIYNLPEFFGLGFYLITQTASAGAVLLLLSVFYVFKEKRFAYAIALSGFITIATTYIFKFIVARPRPELLIEDVITRYDHAIGYGFPSGHTAIATALAIVLLPKLESKYRILIALWVVLVAVSRVYLGVHVPIDLLGGFFVGVFGAYLARVIIRTKKHKNY